MRTYLFTEIYVYSITVFSSYPCDFVLVGFTMNSLFTNLVLGVLVVNSILLCFRCTLEIFVLADFTMNSLFVFTNLVLWVFTINSIIVLSSYLVDFVLADLTMNAFLKNSVLRVFVVYSIIVLPSYPCDFVLEDFATNSLFTNFLFTVLRVFVVCDIIARLFRISDTHSVKFRVWPWKWGVIGFSPPLSFEILHVEEFWFHTK